MANYLVHHGILGQKWGKKNGPPYPLDYKKLSEEERAKDKERTINEGDIKTADYNKDYFSNQEIQAVIQRFDLNQKLSQLNAKQIKSGMDKLNSIANTLGTVSNVINKTADVSNAIGKLSKSFGGDSKSKDKEKTTSYTNLKEVTKNYNKYDDETLTKIANRAGSITKINTNYDLQKKREEDRKKEKATKKLDKKMQKEWDRWYKEAGRYTYK